MYIVSVFHIFTIKSLFPLQMSLSLLKNTLITNCEDHLLKAKYHLMETIHLILQLVYGSIGITTSIASVVALHFCNKFFTTKFQVRECLKYV